MPFDEVAVGSVDAAGRHGDGLAGSGVELFAVAEFAAQSRADQQPMMLVDAQVAAVVQGVHVGAEEKSVVEAVFAADGQRTYVPRTVDPTNRRRNIVEITTAGKRRLVEFDRLINDVQERFLLPLSPTERRQFTRIMHKLAELE